MVAADLPRMARELPRAPGVYLLKDRRGQVLYVGKSKNLRARVGTYFNANGPGTPRDIKTHVLVSKVADFEVIVTQSEFEALLLENSLIKDRAPRYNINLKDGKSYPVIRLTNEEYPKVFRTRTIILDGSEYFGPFPKVNQIDVYLTLIDKLFPLRKRGEVFKRRDQPCLNYHIGRCAAPCVGHIDAAAYQRRVTAVRKLLTGNGAELIRELRALMQQEAAALRFERAAEYRDQVRAIGEVIDSEQDVVDFSREARDYVGCHRDGPHYTVTLFPIRHGQLLGKERFRLVDPAPPEEVLPSFLLQYYAGVQTRPRTVFLRLAEAAAELLQRALDRTLLGTGSELAAVGPDAAGEAGGHGAAAPAPEAPAPGGEAATHGPGVVRTGERRPRAARLAVRVPQRGKHARFLRMAEHNARVDWETGEQQRTDRDAQILALEALRDALGLDAAPRRIEAFDISHLQGSDTVASLVVFVDGHPEKQSYRHFKLRTLGGKVDDFAAMREVIARRYTRAVNDNRPLPDLVLVDGGKGQVSAAVRILRALELGHLPVAGLAKRNEEIFLPGGSNPVILPATSPALRVLQGARDESHRFATGFNRRLRSKRIALSLLESVHGIGRARSRRLLEVFGSVEAILAESPETIASRAGITRETAATLLAHLARQYDRGEVAAAAPPAPG
jgi:excinuclease ABC subunit C